MNTSQILLGDRFSEEKTNQIVKQFHRDGFVHIPGVLTPDGDHRATRHER